MKKQLLAFCLLLSGSLLAIDNNVELIGNGDFATNITAAQTVSGISTAGVWYAGDNTLGTWNTAGGFIADAGTGAFVSTTGAIPTNAFDNFLGQITTDATINSGRYRLSINASGTQAFYIKISSTSALGTELTYILRNPSSAAVEKQGTADYAGYSLKITPTETATTYTADLDLANATPSAIRVYLIFPKVGAVTVDNISLKRTADIPTTYYIRPAGSTAWNNLVAANVITSDVINEGNALSIDPAFTYYVATGNYTTGGLNITSGKIYGGFSGNETSIDLAARPLSDLDGNGIVEPWEFTNEVSIKSSQANSSFAGTGTNISRLLIVSGNGGEVNGVTLSDYNYTTYSGPIMLGKPATTPAAADTISTLAGTLRFCIVKKIKTALTGAIVMTNPYSLIDRCLIESTVNMAGNSGGAINMVSFGGKVEGCVIRNNVSGHATAGRGGAICISTVATSGNVGIVRNCLIYNNAASAQGGAIRIDGQTGKRGVQIINSTIVNNKTGFGGGSSQAAVEFVNGGTIVNSIVVNPALTETGSEIRANTVNSYISNTIYGDSTYTVGGVKSTTMKGKITSELGFLSPTTFSGVSIEGYTTPWDATAISNYNAIRQANFKLASSSSPATILAGAKSLPATYTTTGTVYTISFTAAIPTTDLMSVERPIATSAHLDLGAYQFSGVTTGVTGNTADNSVKIYTLHNGVNICGAKGKLVTVFSLSGQLIKSELINADNSVVNLTKGLYVVRIESQVQKVFVD